MNFTNSQLLPIPIPGQTNNQSSYQEIINQRYATATEIAQNTEQGSTEAGATTDARPKSQATMVARNKRRGTRNTFAGGSEYAS